ncbi:TetR/AcrR family transcriptional regulator [Planomonospora corallina]|uniref:TetR/AcrR family transcriptional regulator n=1 Tax=Planomonospora corallina TaxID=1806052 RepID=A0ABV8I9T9_9ACTN
MASPRYRRLDRDERREQILSVARRMFTEMPYSAVSTTAIAREAGVQRGLVHYYFGAKRELFLEVVRHLTAELALAAPVPPQDLPLPEAVDLCVARFLDIAEANATTWFAAVDAEGFGRDPELVRIIGRTRDLTVEHMLTVLRLPAPGEVLRAVLRAYSGLADAATREWLQGKTLTRSQAHILLSRSLLALVREVVPAVERADLPDQGPERAGLPSPERAGLPSPGPE